MLYLLKSTLDNIAGLSRDLNYYNAIIFVIPFSLSLDRDIARVSKFTVIFTVYILKGDTWKYGSSTFERVSFQLTNSENFITSFVIDGFYYAFRLDTYIETVDVNQ